MEQAGFGLWAGEKGRCDRRRGKGSQRDGAAHHPYRGGRTLRGCAGLAALATAKIRCRRPTLNFQAGSEPQSWMGRSAVSAVPSGLGGIY